MWILRHSASILVLRKRAVFCLVAVVLFSTFAFLVAAATFRLQARWDFLVLSLLTYVTLVPAAIWLLDWAMYFVVLDCESGTLIKRNLFSKSSSSRIIPFDQILGIHTISVSADESPSYEILEMDLVSAESVVFMDCGGEDLKNTRRLEHILRRAIFENEKRVEVLLGP